MIKPTDQLIVALDVATEKEALKIVNTLGDLVRIYKVGSQLFTACGPKIIQELVKRGKRVFLDLKFHDIPNTVANAMGSVVGLNKIMADKKGVNKKRSVSSSGIVMCTVHVRGGAEMLKRAVDEVSKVTKNKGVKKPLIVGITVLTSDDAGVNTPSLVLERAILAKRCGLDGVVASSQEAGLIREKLGKDFIIVTPGIRPSAIESGDQKRIATPFDAISKGSNYLVVGRPILQSKTPKEATQDILKEIKQANNAVASR